METGESIKLNPNEIRDTYHKSMANFNETLRLKCGQYKIDLIEADVALPFSEVLIPFLVKRKNMYWFIEKLTLFLIQKEDEKKVSQPWDW